MATNKNKKKLRAPKVADSELSRVVTNIYDELNKLASGPSEAATQNIRVTSVTQSQLPPNPEFDNVLVDTLSFNTLYTETENENQGTLYWNSDEETLSLVTNGETIELGQKVEIHVKNQTGAQINKGEVVYASGTVGASGRILVTKMIADGTVAAKRVLGVAAENIANGADGKVIKFGKLRQIDTSTFSDGDILWVSTTVAGGFQNTEPIQADGEIALPIAYVVYSSASVGEIFIRVTPIDENEYQDYDAGLQDIAGLTPTDSNIIVGDGTNWVAESGDTARTSLGLGTGDSPTFTGLTVNGSITVTGNVDGRDVSDDGADLDELYTTIGLSALTTEEVNQLENIGETTTIDATQWGYLGALDQNLRTTDAVTFSTVDTGQGANELYAMDQDVQQADSPTFSRVVLSNQADDGTKAVRADRTISAGDGVTGGGDLTADRTITLGTPSTLTVSTTDAVTTNSHTHALDLSGRSITINNDSDSVITFDANTQDLGADRTYTPTIADHASGQRGVLNDGTSAQTIYGDKTFDSDVFINTKIESQETYGAGIFGAGTIYTTNQFPIADTNISFIEVDNMRVRNELRVHIFKKDIVKASNAYLFITDAAEIAEFSDIQDTTDTFRVLDDTNNTNATFEHGDLLWAKNVEDDGSLQVDGVKIQVSAQPKYVWDNSTQEWDADPSLDFSGYTDEFASGTVSGGIFDGKPYKEYNIYEVTEAGELNAGDTIVRVSDGSILNDASSQYSPFIDIYDGVETWADFQDVSKTKVRLGNLSGVSNASGYGLYTQNAFLTGALVVGDLTKAGQYMEFDGSTLTVQGNIVVQGGSGIASFSDAGAFATLDTATLSLISDAGNMAGIDSITAGNATTYIGSGAITTGLIAANTIVAGNIAAGTITATEIAADTITANEIASNTITASEIAAGTITANEIASNTITANEIDANTITANEITAGTITANEIDVADLFAENIEVTGKLTATDGTYEITLGKSLGVDVKIGTSTSNGEFYGLYRDLHNYFGIHDGDLFTEYAFRVGDGSNYLEFDGTNLTIATDTFDLDATTLVIDSGTNSGKIALGSTPPTAYNSGTGIYFDGTGKALIGNATSNKIQFDGTDINIEASNLAIKSTGTSYPDASANTEVTTANVTGFRIATLASGFNTNSLAISNNRWVKFQFDYSQSVPGSFTAGITVTLEVSTDNSTFTDYGLFSDTRIDFNTKYFVADNATGNRLDIVDESDSTKTSFRFKSSQSNSCSGTITMYFYINEKDTTTHVRFNVLDSAGNAADSAPAVLTGASATNIGTRDYNPVTELNPSGVFTRLSDSLILSNGNTYIDYSLIT